MRTRATRAGSGSTTWCRTWRPSARGLCMGWETSDRRSRLPSDWPARRAATRDRAAGRCEGVDLNDTGIRTHVTTCNGIGTDCDHDQRGDDHSLSNLRWLSAECHRAKTATEGPRRKRPPEQHPGRLT